MMMWKILRTMSRWAFNAGIIGLVVVNEWYYPRERRKAKL